ncbi:MAG: hypothetical protein RIQ99_1940 [Pseudomonadota bacterium]
MRGGEGLVPFATSLAVALALFVGMTLLFHFGAVGGGDVKLLAAASLLFPASAVPGVLALIAAAGGILAVSWIGFAWAAQAFGWPARSVVPGTTGGSAKGQEYGDAASAEELGYQGHGLPYGVAIFAGAAAAQVLLR